MADQSYSSVHMARIYDPARGYFEPTRETRTGPMRVSKTAQDSMPVKQRPRYLAWLKTQ